MFRRAMAETNSVLVYKIAETEEEKFEIYDLRESIWREDFPYLLKREAAGHPAKDTFDDRSLLYYCRDAERIIASCRCSPMIDGQWEISASLPTGVRLQYDPQITVQLEKVYIRAGYRNRCLHEFLFYYFSDWVLKHTAYRRYFAVCNAELVRLYRRLGARLARREGLLLTGRGAHEYYLVEGQILEFNMIIRKRYAL